MMVNISYILSLFLKKLSSAEGTTGGKGNIYNNFNIKELKIIITIANLYSKKRKEKLSSTKIYVYMDYIKQYLFNFL